MGDSSTLLVSLIQIICIQPCSLPKSDQTIRGSEQVNRESEDGPIKSKKTFVRQSLATQVIPYPNLPIKYHKTINGIGGDPTRLVIPMKNFTSTLSMH